MRFQLAANDDHTDLHSYIESALTTRMFGSKAFKYLRAAEIRELTSDHNIDIVIKCGTLQFLPGYAKEELSKQARSTARILFLITVAADLPMSNLCLLLLHRGLNDQDLPITNVIYDALEERVKLKEFQALQHLIPPVLKESTFLTSGVDSTLPIEIKSVFAPGTTRRMYRAYMDTEYYKIRTLEQQADDPSLSQMLAVIEINTATPEQESRARSKIEFAQFLADRVHHEHIARSFGTFALSYMFPGETTQYLIAERPVGNLKYYILKRDPQTHHHKKHPALPTDYWLRKQVCGLAKALADIHTPTNGRFGIHHDIRPENILLFEETGQAFTLKFGGSGLAKVHARELEEHQHTSATLGVTMSPYLPPEASNGQPLFRAHDIWSLGCVFLELLMWYTEGQVAYRSFVTAACGKERTQCWFLVENERIFLQPIIRNQLDALEAVQQGKWAGLSYLIRRMLTIAASSRIEAGELSSALYTLLKPRGRFTNVVTRESLLAQFLGLAEALERIHNIAVTEKAGYVHDIKPPNVLVFTKPAPVFKLTDWGRAKISNLSGKNSHKVKKSVVRMMEQLSSDEGGWKFVVQIVEKMLEVKPEERMTAVQLVERLQLVEA